MIAKALFWRPVLRILLAAMVIIWSGVAQADDQSVKIGEGRIIVQGVGQVQRTPDMATIQAGAGPDRPPER